MTRRTGGNNGTRLPSWPAGHRGIPAGLSGRQRRRRAAWRRFASVFPRRGCAVTDAPIREAGDDGEMPVALRIELAGRSLGALRRRLRLVRYGLDAVLAGRARDLPPPGAPRGVLPVGSPSGAEGPRRPAGGGIGNRQI